MGGGRRNWGVILGFFLIVLGIFWKCFILVFIGSNGFRDSSLVLVFLDI